MTGLYGSGIAFYGGNPVLENSIIWGNGGREIYIYDGSVAQVSYCDIGDGGFTGEGNISLNPRFCSPDFGDFSIHETSPCSGTGKGGVDMGAFSRGCEGGSPGNCLKVPSEYTGIKQALDAAYFYGDTVLVAPGTYRGLENTDLNTWGKSLVLKSEMGSGKTIIDCIPD
jgi:hypothetical protein